MARASQSKDNAIKADRWFRLVELNVNGVFYEALVRTVPRSWRIDVWAEVQGSPTYELRYIARIDAPDEESMLETLIRDLLICKEGK